MPPTASCRPLIQLPHGCLAAGLMSGTSADGIDVALVKIRGSGIRTRFQLFAFDTIPYPPRVRQAILASFNAANISVREISHLNFLIGEQFAEALIRVCRRHRLARAALHFIGSHGQTIFHQSQRSRWAGCAVASTLQLGEPAVIAERTGVTTVANFRTRDMAAGGTGAPLVPFVDWLLLRHPRRSRVVLNIGGIANVTIIPKRARPSEVRAFDTGPGNMIIDALASHATSGKMHFDENGELASKGRVREDLLRRWMAHPYFRLRPPKSTGREQFGREWVQTTLARYGRVPLVDMIATATEFTARTIAEQVTRWMPRGFSADEWIASGGGARNPALMGRLRERFPYAKFFSSRDFGIDPDAKEAIAFAILANETLRGRPSNLPSATGARHPVVLGQIVPGA